MKIKNSTLIAFIGVALLLPASGMAQSSGSRAQRTAIFSISIAHNEAYLANDPATTRDTTATELEATSLEAIVPRDGLQFYFEMRNGGLKQLAQAGEAMAPLVKMLARPMNTSAGDFTGFALGQAGALGQARIAIAGYGANGVVALIEAANVADAESLRGALLKLLGGNLRVVKAASSETDWQVSVRGRTVVAGGRAMVARFMESNATVTIGSDEQLMKARARFAADPFFAYLEIGPPPLPPGLGKGNTAYDTGAMLGLGLQPQAVAIGGALEGDHIVAHVQMLTSSNRNNDLFLGLFSSLNAVAQTGQPQAATFTAPDADIFVDFMVDWNKLFDMLQTMFSRVANTQASSASPTGEAGSLDLVAIAEASLGFSIRNELIPTLGNEVALSFSGFDQMLLARAGPSTRRTSAASRTLPPRFMLMVALKDQPKFEKLMAKIFSKPGALPPARTVYRNVVINTYKEMACAVANHFFMIGSMTEIRRALDAHATGNSLAATADYRAVVSPSSRTAMQAYLSAAVTNRFYNELLKGAAQSTGSVKELAVSTPHVRSAIGVTMMPDTDGAILEVRVPTNLTFMALASLASGQPATVSVAGVPGGLGIPFPTKPATSSRGPDGRRVPRLTDDDLRDRRP
jgi:hypothetical protein